MALTVPVRPKGFAPDLPPPGYRVDYVNFQAERKTIAPRLQLIHTNGASVESSIESAKNWAERRVVNGNATTLPTFQVDRDGDAAMFININQAQNACYKVNSWAISYETADTGYKDDPTISGFTGAQLQALANGCAYCSVLFKIPLEYPSTWDGTGTASHTEPFGYPYWTNSNGKICPGNKKKAQVRDIILPHARLIVEAWMTPPKPIPPPHPLKDDDMLYLIRLDTNQNLWMVGDGITSRRVRSDEMDELTNAVTKGIGPQYRDPTKPDRPVITDMAKVPTGSDDFLQLLGVEITESVDQP
jgi:hypothetical protein